MKNFTLFICAALLGTAAADAVPAKRVWRTFTQPDGTTVELMQGGDEFSHFFMTRQGDYVLCDTDGSFRYATVDKRGELTTLGIKVESRSKANVAVDKAAVEKALAARADAKREARVAVSARSDKKAPAQVGMGRFTSNYPRTGDVRCLVFLVEYKDVKFKVSDPQKYYDEFCNSENFTKDGATGSVAQYFRDQSDNMFRPVYDVFGPVPLKNNRAYYGGNTAGGDDKAAEEMVVEAVEYYKNEIDFSKYDFDNDGYVDNIFILYAGQGEASYGPATSVWPHSFELHYVMTCPQYNGKRVDSYTCTNEWELNGPEGIGTFCHEFSHTMGLPDLYHTSNSSAAYTPGSWSVLDYGPYNNEGRTPPNYSIFERNAMGWLEPSVLDGPACITLEPITSNTGYLIETEKTNEFFLLENRQQKGWDTFIPGHGMLIWHIDFNQAKFNDNSVNNSKTHQYVDIVEANNEANSNNEQTMAGYAFPGTAKNTSFTSTTTPAMKSWSGRDVDMPITNIVEQSGKIMFDVAGGYFELDTPTGVKASANQDGILSVSWDAVQNAAFYTVTVTQLVEGVRVPFGKYSDFNVGDVTGVEIEGVAGRTEYFVTVSAFKGQFSSDPSEEISVVTPAVPMEKITPSIISWDTSSTSSFTISWMPIEDAVDYLVTVKSVARGGESKQVFGFGSASSSEFPADWTCVGNPEYYSSANNYGEAIPSFKMGVKSTAFTTGLFPSDIIGLSFWMRGMSTNTKSYLSISGRADEGADWVDVKPQIYTIDYNSKGEIITVDVPEGIRQLNFTYNKGTGNIGIDDITVTFAGEEKTIHADYDRKSVGKVTSHQVVISDGGRAAESLGFEAYVEAVDAGGKVSRPSEAVRVTPCTTGIDLPADGSAMVSVDGATISYTGNDGDLCLYNAAGIAVARTVAQSGEAVIEAPAQGLYILATPDGAVKLLINRH